MIQLTEEFRCSSETWVVRLCRTITRVTREAVGPTQSGMWWWGEMRASPLYAVPKHGCHVLVESVNSLPCTPIWAEFSFRQQQKFCHHSTVVLLRNQCQSLTKKYWGWCGLSENLAAYNHSIQKCRMRAGYLPLCFSDDMAVQYARNCCWSETFQIRYPKASVLCFIPILPQQLAVVWYGSWNVRRPVCAKARWCCRFISFVFHHLLR